ncbi:hypothetical protein MASR1M45_24990 [Candidatus Kapaibacterium sp.]
MKRLTFIIIMMIAGAVIFSGFQCASRNITTAKVKIKNQQYNEAEESLNKELAVNPNSEEALALMADINFQQKNFKEAAKYAKKVIEVGKTPAILNQQQILINNIWVECYNAGIGYYNAFGTSKRTNLLDSALQNFKIGLELRPQMLDFYYFIGAVHELRNDKAAAVQAYTDYVNAFDKNYKFGLKNGLYTRAPRATALEKLGAPKLAMPGLTAKGDSTFSDYYVIDGKETYIFSEVIDGKMVVVGWNYDIPQNWLPNEKKIKTEINSSPIAYLAQHYYNEKQLENSLKYIKMLIDLEPDNSNAYASMIGIYQDLNKTDEAIKAIQDRIKVEPKNPMYVTQLADLYQGLQKYDESIATYQKAIEIQPNYERAIRNLAAAHKNRASVKQRAEQDKSDANKTYKIDPEKYLPDLRESAKYFAKALEFKAFQNDMMVLTELANIYQVIEDKESLKKIVRNLEAIEFTIEESKRNEYYLRMLKIYSEMGEANKATEIQKKIK